MEKVFEIIKEYDIEIERIKSEGISLFRCKGRQSNVIFYLDMNFDELKTFKKYDDKEINGTIIYVITIQGEIDNILTKIDKFDEKEGHILVYDPNEEIEFFSKDFWNLYITLTR